MYIYEITWQIKHCLKLLEWNLLKYFEILIDVNQMQLKTNVFIWILKNQSICYKNFLSAS